MKLVFCITVASYFYLWFILCTIFYWFLNSWYCLLFCICSILIFSDIVFLSVSFVVSYFFYFIPAFRPNFSPQCLLFCCTLSLFSKWVPLLTCLAIGLHNFFSGILNHSFPPLALRPTSGDDQGGIRCHCFCSTYWVAFFGQHLFRAP